MKVSIKFIETGYCTHPEWTVLRGGSRKNISFPSSVAVIEHEQEGVILFDTGYANRFYDATKHLPERLYRVVTPVFSDEAQSAKNQLQKMGIAPKDVRHVVVSHFHGDHVAGLKDFPEAQLICMGEGYEAVRKLRGLRALTKAFLPSLMPADFAQRAKFIDSGEFVRQGALPKQFPKGMDLFGDGRLFLVPLPGHARGQAGLFVVAEDASYFLVADACWQSKSFQENIMPHGVTRLLQDDFGVYAKTLGEIHALHKSQEAVKIIPCHCTSGVVLEGSL